MAGERCSRCTVRAGSSSTHEAGLHYNKSGDSSSSINTFLKSSRTLSPTMGFHLRTEPLVGLLYTDAIHSSTKTPFVTVVTKQSAQCY